MASKLSLRALSMRTTTTTTSTPLNRLCTTAAALRRGPHCRASFSDKATSGADAAPPLSAATEAWIAKLKEMHGDRWQSVYDESRARQARNEELIREKHRQQQQLKQMKKGGKKAKAAAAAAAAGTKGEGQGGAEGRVGQTEEAWIEQLKARHGERGWRVVYEQRKAAFEAGTAKSDRAAELLREKSRAEKKARQQEERRVRAAEEAKAKMEAELRGK